jgi:type IV secretion system protein VirD4
MAEDASIFKSFLRGIPGGQDGSAPSERFQDEQAVLNSAALRFSPDNHEGKIFLGLAGAAVVVDPKEPRLPDGRTNRYAVGGALIGVGDDRHVITIAGSRAGKGRAGLIPNLLMYPGSVLVLDPKGDLARITADRRRKMGQTVYVLDPYDTAGAGARSYAATFNPLATLEGSTDLLADAGVIADALVVPSGGKGDPHWDDSARHLIEGLVLHVATSPLYAGKRHLVEVHDLMWKLLKPEPGTDPTAGRFRVRTEMEQNTGAGGAVMHAASDFYERADRERDSVLSTARRHLHFLGYEKIQKTLLGSSFDLRDLKRKPVTIYVSLPAMHMGICSRWLRLFVNLTLVSMEREKTHPRYPVLMCLDEFPVLGTMASIQDAAGQIAGLDCKLWVVLQDLGQLKALYADRWETFLGNAGVLQFFGNSELVTLEWIAKRLGTTSITTHSQSNVPYQTAATTGSTGKAWSTATCELMNVGELARFFGRDDELLRQLIIRPTVPPLVLQRAFFDKHEFFGDKFTPDRAGQ